MPLPLILILSTFAFQPAAAQSADKTVWDGVYTAAQAKRGESAYAANCARCHRDDLSGYNGVLLGGKFMDRWREDSLQSFFHNVQSTMPRDAPASLSDSAYLDIVAYVLRKNQFPEGTGDLTVAALPKVRVQSKQGPEPVPDFSLVEVEGCMAQAGDGAWQVVKGTEPVRTRNPGASAPEELAGLKDKTLGSHTFRMMDLDSVGAKPVKDQAVLVKGFLIRQPNDDRINLTDLQTIAANCR